MNWTFKMAEFVGISEGYEYQHNATKKRQSNIRNPWKFKIRNTFLTDHVYSNTISHVFGFPVAFVKLNSASRWRFLKVARSACRFFLNRVTRRSIWKRKRAKTHASNCLQYDIVAYDHKWIEIRPTISSPQTLNSSLDKYPAAKVLT